MKNIILRQTLNSFRYLSYRKYRNKLFIAILKCSHKGQFSLGCINHSSSDVIFLHHVSFLFELFQRLVSSCGEVQAAPTEIEEIQFLCTVCAKIKADPYLVNFFLEVGIFISF